MTFVKFHSVSDAANQLCRASNAFPRTANINTKPNGVSAKQYAKQLAKTRAATQG